ncbi:N-6 DNA methylase [Kitasatospora sp. NPDC059811]|uniref:type I restriction-modification system subunit M/S n=1 Tax=Streptomycetaceae TaxID=2062 RepID=UPI0007AF311A|nr:type I restriction-modification system subunit M/S [Streptomyces sp. MJM8645]
METSAPESRDAELADRLWRAYAPYQRGRNGFRDLTLMLAVLLLARLIETAEPQDELVMRWDRAVADARFRGSPLRDLRAALDSVRRSRGLGLTVDLLDGEGPDDVPWAVPFLEALGHRPGSEANLAEVAELLIERQSQETDVSAGEFYTPREVVRLVVDLAEPQAGDRIFDPACGTGGFLTEAAQRISGHGGLGGTSFEAYTTDLGAPRLATVNLALHGVDQPVVRASDPAMLLQSRGYGLADVVMSNPPFNQRAMNLDHVGLPPDSSANYAWLQLAWSRLSEHGTAAVIMPPSAAWSGGADETHRQNLVAQGAVLGIIALPANLFPATTVAVHIWLLARNKSGRLPVGEADSVLFVDASQLGSPTPRKPRALTPADIERITSRFRAWLQSPGAVADEPGFSRSVGYDEITANAGNLDPRLYVAPTRERPAAALDLDNTLDELHGHALATAESVSELSELADRCERLTGNEEEPPLLTLRDAVNGAPGNTKANRLLAGPSGSLIRADDYVQGGGVPVVMPKDLTDSGFNTTDIRYITEAQAERLERFRLRRGDLVVARRGELGRCAVVREEQHGWVCGTGCFLLRPHPALNPDYLAAYLRSAQARDWLDNHSTGSMTMKTISLPILADLPVVLPDLATQQTIASLMTRLDIHEHQLREQLTLTRQLRRDALQGFLAPGA